MLIAIIAIGYCNIDNSASRLGKFSFSSLRGRWIYYLPGVTTPVSGDR